MRSRTHDKSISLATRIALVASSFKEIAYGWSDIDRASGSLIEDVSPVLSRGREEAGVGRTRHAAQCSRVLLELVLAPGDVSAVIVIVVMRCGDKAAEEAVRFVVRAG